MECGTHCLGSSVAIDFDLLPWFVFLSLIVLWEVAVQAIAIPEFVLPAPTVVIGSIFKWWEFIWLNAIQTLQTTVVGFVFANVLSFSESLLDLQL